MGKNATGEPGLEVTLGLLRAVHKDQALTQRSAARELGIALGLVNTYLKRCVTKGLIKISQTPNNRYAYFLTPKGFAEKSRLTAEFLSQSLNLFRQAQADYTELLQTCADEGWSRIVLCGVSDLTEIISLYARDFPVTIIAVVDENHAETSAHGLPVVSSLDLLPGSFDACIITDLHTPQATYDALTTAIRKERILVPELLDVVTNSENTGGGA